MRTLRTGVVGVAWLGASLVLVALLPVPRARAEDTPAPAPWGFNGASGTGGASGDFGNLFKNPVSWEYNFFHQRGAFVFLRNSDYTFTVTETGREVFQHIRQRNPQLRVYLAMSR